MGQAFTTTLRQLFTAPATAGFMLLCALPLVLLLFGPRMQWSGALLPLIPVLLYSALRLTQLAIDGRKTLTTLTFWLFVYVFFGVCALVQTSTGMYPWGNRYDEPVLIYTGFLILVGLLAFEIGGWLARGARTSALRTILLQRIRPHAVRALLAIGVVLVPTVVYVMGGQEIVFENRSHRFKKLMEDFSLAEIHLLTHFSRTYTYVITLAYAALVLSRWTRGIRPGGLSIVVLAFLALVTVVLNNPVSTPRFMVGTVVLSVLFLMPWPRWGNGALVAALVTGFVVAFPVADNLRTRDGPPVIERLTDLSLVDNVTDHEFDAYQMVVDSTRAVERSGLQMGRQIGGAFLFWVPRSIWSEKPIATGHWVSGQLGYEFKNRSAPLWAEFYVDGSWPLLLLGFGVYGFGLRMIDRVYLESLGKQELRFAAVMVPILAAYQFFLLRGALMSTISNLAPLILFVLLCTAGRWRLRRVPERGGEGSA